jgi:hypothetical protein
MLSPSAFSLLPKEIAFGIATWVALAGNIFLVLIASDKLGMSYAEKFIERTKEGLVKIKTIQFKTITEEYMEYSVICNDFQCAYFANGTLLLLTIEIF